MGENHTNVVKWDNLLLENSLLDFKRMSPLLTATPGQDGEQCAGEKDKFRPFMSDSQRETRQTSSLDTVDDFLPRLHD